MTLISIAHTTITDQAVICRECGQILLRIGTHQWNAGTCRCTWLPTNGPSCDATITTPAGATPCGIAPAGSCPLHDTPRR